MSTIMDLSDLALGTTNSQTVIDSSKMTKTTVGDMEEGTGRNLHEDDDDAKSEISQASTKLTNGLQKDRHRRNTNIILMAMICLATGLVLVTYFLLKKGEIIEFETAFNIYARELDVVVNMRSENVFGQLQSLATEVRTTSSSSTINNDGDHSVVHYRHEVTIPDFDLRAEEITNMTGIEMLMFVPFVPNEQRESFEEYQRNNQQWITEGFEHRGWDTSNLLHIPSKIHNYTLPEGYNDTRRGYVDSGFMEEIVANRTNGIVGAGMSLPIAQIGPRLMDTSIVNLDLFTHPIFKKETVASLEYGVPVVSELEDLKFLLKNVQLTTNETYSSSEVVDYSLPRSFTLDPVRAGYDDNDPIIGFVVGVIQWNTFFKDIVPVDVHGIVVEVVSDCGRSFTYVVNGGKDDEWYLDFDEDGSVLVEELADKKTKEKKAYQYLEKEYKFFWKEHHKGTSRHCHFDLLITPNEDFASAYITQTPIFYAGVVLAGFVFLGLCFFIYDYYNHKKHVRVTREKARAEAVVSSLFPKHVGARLLQDSQSSNVGSTQKTVKSSETESPEDDHEEQQRSKPMADLFPSATVMFADIAGFTAWSSERDPTDVFHLLETVYHAFDAIAKRRKVFKIETIGDCYVAVCGLPTPRLNHAVVMAKFAQNCLDKFREIVIMLDTELPGTASLNLRTGLHCGEVTAGVLRGDRARFQLFGDTVNTTSRVESTGKGGQIHVSQQFADELIKYGKPHWIVPREDAVQAKGKGMLTTYWLRVLDFDGSRSKMGSTTDYTSTMTEDREKIENHAEDR